MIAEAQHHQVVSRLLGAFMLAAMALCLHGIPAQASDATPLSTKDKHFDFYFEYFGDSRNSGITPKDNDSASYIWVNNMTIYDVHLYVDGYKDGAWNFRCIPS